MTIDDKIRDVQYNKLQYDTIRSDQSKLREQVKFTYSPLGKSFDKQIKIIDQGIKQAEALEALKSKKNKRNIKSVKESFPKDTRTNEINDEIDEIKKWQEKIKRKDLKYEPKNYIYNFQQYERYYLYY